MNLSAKKNLRNKIVIAKKPMTNLHEMNSMSQISDILLYATQKY